MIRSAAINTPFIIVVITIPPSLTKVGGKGLVGGTIAPPFIPSGIAFPPGGRAVST
jgi:hypothetical protein